jgi:uncharacterized membrane protein
MIARLITGRDRLVIWGLLIGIFFLGMGLRLYELDADSLWMDEISGAMFSKLDLPSLVATISERNDAPLLYLVTHVLVTILGDGEFALRFPAVLLGSLSVLLSYKLGEILWSRREGLLAAFLLASNSYHIHYSQEFRQYALMVFLALFSLILLLKALRNNQWTLWIGFVASASLGLYNHGFAFLVLLAEVIYAVWILWQDWLTTRRRGNRPTGNSSQVSLDPARRSFMLVLSLSLIALAYVPWLTIFWGQASRHIASSPTAESAADPLLSLAFLREVILTFSAGIGTGHLWVETASAGGILAQEALEISVWQGLAVLLFVALFVYGLIGCRRDRLMLVVPWLATPFVLLCFVTRNRFVHARYVLYILPIYLLLIARGSVRLSQVLSRRLGTRGVGGKRLLALTVVPALLLGLLSLESARLSYASHREDWRSVAWYLKDNLASHDVVLADGKAYRPEGDDRRVMQCLSYYLSPLGSPEPPIVPVRPIVWRHLERIEHSDGGVWAVIWYPDRPATWDAVEEIAVTDFQDLAVLRLREPSTVLFRDTVDMLQVLVGLLPPEARFDVHLALAEMYLRTGRYQHAELELRSAAQVKPDSPGASQDLDDESAKLQALSRSLEDMQRPLWKNLGLQLALLGYTLDPPTARASSTVELTLWWMPLATMDKDYTAFIHLVDEEGRIWAQQDKLLQHNDRPTSTWEMGKIVREEYELELAADTPPGEYAVKAGTYYWQTGERLPVWDEFGGRVADDAILLGPISVED